MTRSEQWRIVVVLAGGLAPLAALVGLVPGYFLGDGSLPSTLVGGAIGLLIGVGMLSFQVSWGVGLISRDLREEPFLVALLVNSVTWLAIIFVGGRPLFGRAL